MGPFRVIQVISPTAYKLELPENMKMHPVFHISLLKEYKTSEEFARRIPPPPIISDAKEEEYEVEDILDKKMVKQRPHYLIKWLGYPLHEATWKPLKSLKNAQETLRKFESMRTFDF